MTARRVSNTIARAHMMEELVRICFAGVHELSRAEKYQHDHIDPPWYARQFRLYPSIFGQPMIHDVYYCGGNFPQGLVLEVKWQSSPGSVYEKLPFTLLSLASMPGTKVLIIGGLYYPNWVVEWCRNYAKAYQNLFVMNFDEFTVWVRRKDGMAVALTG